MAPAEMLEHLSAISEQYGIRYEYIIDGEDTHLAINTTENPEVNTCLNAMVTAIGLLAQCCYQTVAVYSREEPLAVRHQNIHMLTNDISEVCGGHLNEVVNQIRTDIEIVH